jgi:hypothetical protein
MDVAILSAVSGACASAVVAEGVRRIRAAQRRRRQRWPNESWATEASALRLRLSGTLNRNDYRKIVEGIAARDDLARPVSVPRSSPSADR